MYNVHTCTQKKALSNYCIHRANWKENLEICHKSLWALFQTPLQTPVAEHYTGNAEVFGFNPVEAPNCFQAF